jgi:hypothetical protein
MSASGDIVLRFPLRVGNKKDRNIIIGSRNSVINNISTEGGIATCNS